MSLPAVLVEWEDAASYDRWNDIADFEMVPNFCHTLGFIIQEDAHRVAIAGTTGDSDACCVIVIPRGMIRQILNVASGEPYVPA